HPAGAAREPEDLGAVALGIEEVAADRARVGHDVVDLATRVDDAAIELAHVVERADAQGDLLDQVGILGGLGAAAHEGDLVVGLLRLGAEEDHAPLPVLLRERHAHDVAVERDHLLQVAAVDADVPEPEDLCPCHYSSRLASRLETAIPLLHWPSFYTPPVRSPTIAGARACCTQRVAQ